MIQVSQQAAEIHCTLVSLSDRHTWVQQIAVTFIGMPDSLYAEDNTLKKWTHANTAPEPAEKLRLSRKWRDMPEGSSNSSIPPLNNIPNRGCKQTRIVRLLPLSWLSAIPAVIFVRYFRTRALHPIHETHPRLEHVGSVSVGSKA